MTAVGHRAVRPPLRYVWLSVYGMLVATLLGFGAGIGYFVIGGIWGPLSDLTSVFVAVFLVPVVRGLHRLHRDEADRSGTVHAVGLIAAGLLGLGSIGLVLPSPVSTTPFDGLFLGLQFAGIALEGVWLIGIGVVTRDAGVLGPRQGVAGIAAGIGYTVTILGLAASLSYMHPIVLGGGLLSLVGLVFWAGLLGSDLRALARERQPVASMEPGGD